MADLALNLSFPEDTQHLPEQDNVIYLLKGEEGEHFIFCRGQLLSSYDCRDLYARNYIIAQLFLCHKVSQKALSALFALTVPHISTLVGRYRREGSTGIEDNTVVRLKNNQKIKGKVADFIVERLVLEEANRPTYKELSAHIGKKFGISISGDRVGNWWRIYKKNRLQETLNNDDQRHQLPLIEEKEASSEGLSQQLPPSDIDMNTGEIGQWQDNAVAGSFILYAMLNKSQFLSPFKCLIKSTLHTGRQHIERVMLTLYFMHALRLKSIEQTKHLSAKHFAPLVLGPFCREQNLRYAIDAITEHERFDDAMLLHYKNMAIQTKVGDEIYYTDGHFSCYYGKHPIPKGYDARRKQASRGRNTIYLHNSLGHNILSFESPTNTTLNVDIAILLDKMKEAFGNIESKTLFFDRGGFSAKCFTGIKNKGMYFATYLKHRKKGSEIAPTLLTEVEVEINGENIKNTLYEKARETKKYGVIRTIIFVGKNEKQIPIITTNLDLSAAEIVARLQKRWVEENGFKYMGDHYNIDLLTTYKTEEAPDKVMERRHPGRKKINKLISGKKAELTRLKSEYSSRLMSVKEKATLSISAFEKQEDKWLLSIKSAEMELGLLALKREDTPCKVNSNLKDECVISKQKRRLLINLVKSMNYNSEKWLQELFCEFHPKKDETLSLIRSVLKAPGRVRERRGGVEVELERLDSRVQAKSLDNVLEKLNKYNYLWLPDGRKLDISQAA